MNFAIDRSRPTMAWYMVPVKHALRDVYRATDLTGRYQQIVRGCDMVFVSKDVAEAVALGKAVAR